MKSKDQDLAFPSRGPRHFVIVLSEKQAANPYLLACKSGEFMNASKHQSTTFYKNFKPPGNYSPQTVRPWTN